MLFSRVSLVVVSSELTESYLRIVKHVLDFLVAESSVQQIILEKAVADWMITHTSCLDAAQIRIVSCLRDQLRDADLIVVIGGDGSVLRVARMTIAVPIPIIGINKGQLGFLADLHSGHFVDALRGILHGEYVLERRPVLRLQQHDEQKRLVALADIDTNEPSDSVYAINELTVQGDAQMIVFEVAIADHHVFQQRGDGMMVSTPTGSTGHCLSAGGPIVAPDVAAMCLVPICPHNLSSRPVIINPSSQVVIRLLSENRVATWCADGVILPTSLRTNCSVSVSLLPDAFILLHAPHYRFLTNCADKLGWEKPNA